ncbi:MFS general substrate transporter [Periconia macrospinosa]|uniref:MFS general substrate transporter n=1 Tax=Periconia macrospinosa TaxID=97972 RepID=A0A2V1DTL2_9PLEO|nr:MFS general substrate transporter [Periconia macrospinosa]
MSLPLSEQNRNSHESDCEPASYLHGWRLHLLSLSIALCMFLVNIEVSIVGTSLVSISDELHGFDQMGWVVTGYLITYTTNNIHSGMIIIWAKLSDIFGRKWPMITTVAIFVAFSGGCGAAQSMDQLIICRVFQGIGAAGCSSLALTIAYEMVPKDKYPVQAAQLAGATAFGSLVGPLIGGGASQNAEWRWVFLFNVPVGVVTILLLFITLPSKFPHQSDPSYHSPSWRQRLSRASLARLDVSGAFLLLGATMLLVAVLLEGGVSIAWSSATSIILFVISGVMWIAFVANEWFFTKEKFRTEPIFPWRFLHDRAWMGTLIISMLSGIPYNIIVIDIPQRFQAVSGLTPFDAGVRLLPFNFLISFASVMVNVIAGATGILPVYILLFGSAIQLVGLALFSTLPTDGTIPAAIYGYQVLGGFGIGCVMGILLQIPPQVVQKRDIAISSGALLQFRVFGGALGLSITTSAMNNYLSSHMPAAVGGTSASALLQSVEVIREYPHEVQAQILKAFAEGYNLQMKIMVGFAALQVLVVGMLWRKNQIRLPARKKSAS